MRVRTRLVLAVGTVLILIFVGAYAFIYDAQHKQAEALYRAQALAIDNCTDLVSNTISKHGGIWVEQKDGVTVNPFLAKIPNIPVEMKSEKGKRFARMNGFVFVQEMMSSSESVLRSSNLNVDFKFRAPSDKAINPINKTTPIEQLHLDKMRKEGLEEYSLFSKDKNGNPLYVHNRARRISDETCIKPCHTDYSMGAIESMKTVTLPIAKAEAMKQESLRHISYFFLAAIIVILGVIFLISKRVTDPICQLVKATNRISEGELDFKIDIERNDEIGRLAEAFNHMIGKVNNSQEELKRLHLDLVKAFVRAIEAKDPYTRGHSENVAKYAVLLGKELKLSSEQMDELEIAALLHDVGKIGIREDILNKPATLTDEEYEHVKQHPNISADIVGSIPGLAQISDAIKHHHERFDGGGYPDGVSGTEIPYMARMLALADTFDAMTSNRPYRRGCDKEKALNELRTCAGKQFDADLVVPFIKALANIELVQQCEELEADSANKSTA